jgi:hypothetical protein
MDNIKFIVDFYYGCKVEILGEPDKEYPDDDLYNVQFFNEKTGQLIYETNLKPNHWTTPSIKYFIPWRVFVYKNGSMILNKVLLLKNKKVLIAMDTKPLGDNIAWLSHILEFSKKHQCEIVVQTPFHELFSKVFPKLTYVPSDTYRLDNKNFYASYKVQYGFINNENLNLDKELDKRTSPGYVTGISFWNKDESPYHPSLKPLSEFGSSVLGLDFIERRPIFETINPDRPIEKKYVCISEFASGYEKQWINKIGWQTVVNELKSLGYEVISISKEKTNLKNVVKRNGDFNLEDRIWYLQHCEFFIGVSSGLSWLAWASKSKVVMISGITLKNNEFSEDCIRIINENVCHGCWNLEKHCDKFVYRKDFICPENKNFTCSRSISPKMVMDEIKKHLIL